MKKMKTWKRLLVILLLCVLGYSIFSILRKEHDYQVGRADYSDATTVAKLPDLSAITHDPIDRPTPTEESEMPEESKEPHIDPYADALRDMDFEALQEVNPDVLGWILIPGTRLSYPIVQGENNRYYLNHTWRKSYSGVGSIFMESQNNRDFSDFHTLIYGHRMSDNSMFFTITKYKSQSFYEEHPVVYITDVNGTKTYDIYAAFEADSPGTIFQLISSPDSAKQEFIDLGLEQSVITTGLTPTVKDHILTLSTCTGHGHEARWVVQAVLRVEEEELEAEESDGIDSPVTPEAENDVPVEEGDSADESHFLT